MPQPPESRHSLTMPKVTPTLYPVVTVESVELTGHLTTKELAEHMGVDQSIIRRYKRELKKKEHPLFIDYEAGDLLSEEMWRLVIRYREATTAGIRGDALLDAIFSESSLYERLETALRQKHQDLKISEKTSNELITFITRLLKSEIA
mgnify:CR=1 FL=1